MVELASELLSSIVADADAVADDGAEGGAGTMFQESLVLPPRPDEMEEVMFIDTRIDIYLLVERQSTIDIDKIVL